MRLLVGLGNPGSKHAGNRHNAGFMAVDAIVRRHSFGPFKSRFQALLAEGTVDSQRLLVMKPLTFMNESGRAVGEALRFFKLIPAQVLVIHDELDLAAGKAKLKLGGGSAGHNGLRSIDAHIGPDYWRLRIGIGHPGDKRLVHPYVLSDFVKADAEWLDKLLGAVAEALPLLVADEDNRFMTRLALLTKPPPPKRPAKPDGSASPGGGAAGADTPSEDKDTEV